MAKDCPDKPIDLCKNCGKEGKRVGKFKYRLLIHAGHKVAQCTDARAVDFSGVETKSAEDAWTQLAEADKSRDLDDVRDVSWSPNLVLVLTVSGRHGVRQGCTDYNVLRA